MSGVLQVEDDGRVRWLTLNRPERLNALSRELGHELAGALRAAGRDDGVRCVVVTGAGRTFCAGADVEELAVSASETWSSSDADQAMIVDQLRTMHVPTIACLNGPATGLGASIAMACDLRYGGVDSPLSFSSLRLGLSPDGGLTSMMTRTVGRARAFDLLYTGRQVIADDAFRLGLLNGVFPAAELKAAVRGLAGGLAAGPRGALAAIKRSINHSEESDFDDGREFESILYSLQLSGPESREGLAALREHRAADFTNL
jgi:enoyl-CoA hydratase/carnithine racemase